MFYAVAFEASTIDPDDETDVDTRIFTIVVRETPYCDLREDARREAESYAEAFDLGTVGKLVEIREMGESETRAFVQSERMASIL